MPPKTIRLGDSGTAESREAPVQALLSPEGRSVKTPGLGQGGERQGKESAATSRHTHSPGSGCLLTGGQEKETATFRTGRQSTFTSFWGRSTSSPSHP